MMPGCGIHGIDARRSRRERIARGSSAANRRATPARPGASSVTAHTASLKPRPRQTASASRRSRRLRADGVEQHGLGGQARPERHGAAACAGGAVPQHPLQHEHHCCRRHVAVAGAAPRATAQRRRRQLEGALDRVEHGMRRRDAPPKDRSTLTGRRPRMACALGAQAPRGWRAEPGPTAPCRSPSRGCSRSSDRGCPAPARRGSCRARAVRLGRDQRRRAAVAEQQETEQLLDIGVSCRCSVQSSMLTTSTRAFGSERTMWRASFSPLIAA